MITIYYMEKITWETLSVSTGRKTCRIPFLRIDAIILTERALMASNGFTVGKMVKCPDPAG
jgi:hypothetical protein